MLHYEDIQAPIHRDEVIRRLKRHFHGYEKGTRNTYETTRHQIDIATQRARLLASKYTAYDSGPYTAIVDLVTLLTSFTFPSAR
ncbi:MAG: hypothetical protein LBS49_08115 [Candidatus Accumulibacter sp.]|nr:hypothetical protein [Accumulibacter sp.]